MPDYKKKNVKKLKAVKPKKTVSENYKLRAFDESKIDEDIPVKSAELAKRERKFQKEKQRYLNKEQPKKRVVLSNKSPSELNRASSPLKVLSGTKKFKTIKRVSAIIVTAAIIVSLVILHLLSPTGLSEKLSNSFVKIGSGTGFPITLNGDSVCDIENFNDCVATLSDTYFEVFNLHSKEMLSEQHGFSDPVLKVAFERALIYDRNGKEYKIYNLSEKLISKKIKEEIITAEIGRNGTFAIVTDSKKSASKLYVYNKNNEELFSWESQEGMINSVAVSDSGDTVALTTLKVKGGKYCSDVIIFDIKTEKKIYNNEYKALSYSVAASDLGYVLCTEDGVVSISEETLSEKSLLKNKPTIFMKSDRFGVVCTEGIVNSDSDEKMLLFKEEDKEFFSGEASSPEFISLSEDQIAYSSDGWIYVLNMNGETVYKYELESSQNKFVIIDKSIFVLNNMVLNEVKLNESEES